MFRHIRLIIVCLGIVEYCLGVSLLPSAVQVRALHFNRFVVFWVVNSPTHVWQSDILIPHARPPSAKQHDMTVRKVVKDVLGLDRQTPIEVTIDCA